MVKTDRKLLLKSIDIVFQEKNEILANEQKLQDFSENLEVISAYFKITQREAFIFALAFVLSFSETKITFTNLSNLAPNSTTDILNYREELEALCKKKILKKISYNSNDSLFDVSYSVNNIVALNILDNKPFNKKAKSTRKFRSVIKPESINFKDLIFNEAEVKQLASLKELLKKDSFENLTQLLKKLNMPSGVAALFHGGSGTGKTESVLQMARESGREILKVDISRTKSMWYGQTEKMVKEIFTEYKAFKKECKRVPILFINEADALISKRRDLSMTRNSNTENTVQNILLEELENFTGIMIATTNLIQNIDSAFDRRFLFKVYFPEPDQEIRAKIWQSKIPALNATESLQLATQFKLSGGHIENIATKLIIEETIFGQKLPLEKITELCSNELLNRKEKTRPVGFK